MLNLVMCASKNESSTESISQYMQPHTHSLSSRRLLSMISTRIVERRHPSTLNTAPVCTSRLSSDWRSVRRVWQLGCFPFQYDYRQGKGQERVDESGGGAAEVMNLCHAAEAT